MLGNQLPIGANLSLTQLESYHHPFHLMEYFSFGFNEPVSILAHIIVLFFLIEFGNIETLEH